MAWLDILIERLTGMGRGALRMLPNLLGAILIFALFLVAARIVRGVIERLGRRLHKHQNAGVILGRLSQWLLTLVGLLVAITILVPSFKLGTLVETLGLASVAIGFAFRDVLQNFLAGILILWTEPFGIDDQVVYKEFEGTVEEIQTRATFIRTYDGRRVVVPNSELFTSAITVNTAFERRRVEYDVGIGVSDDIEHAKQIILSALGEIEGVLAEPAPDVLVIELADFSVKLRVRWWIHPPRRADMLAARDAVLVRIKRALLEHGIDLPFPTTQVLFHDQTEKTDGDRRHQREGWPAGTSKVPGPRRDKADSSAARGPASRE